MSKAVILSAVILAKTLIKFRSAFVLLLWTALPASRQRLESNLRSSANFPEWMDTFILTYGIPFISDQSR